MKKLILIFCIAAVTVSCNSKEKKTEAVIEKKVEVKRNMNDFLIFDNALTEENIEDAEYKNITFQKEGAVFTRESKKPTYIKIPFTDFDFNQGFNISFTFKTTFDDGRKPQSFIAFIGKRSSASRIPLYLYLPGNKISGVYGEQSLWAENYDKKNKRSRMFFDSYKIQKEASYFVSVNFNGDTINIYLNSELYATYEGLKPHQFKSEYLLIGAMMQAEKVMLPFEGTMYGLKIYNKPLEEKEIVSLFNKQPTFFEF